MEGLSGHPSNSGSIDMIELAMDFLMQKKKNK